MQFLTGKREDFVVSTVFEEMVETLPYKIHLSGHARFGQTNNFFAEAADPGFFNGIFFFAVAIAAACTLADWVLSKEQKKSIKEKVADYWTTLQYEKLDVLFRKAWHQSALQLLWLIGLRSLSLRRLCIAPVLQLMLTYIGWWLSFSLLYASKGWHFGPLHRPAIFFYVTSASWHIYFFFIVWLFLASWIGWSGFAVVLSRFDWTRPALIRSFLIFLGSALFLLVVTCTVLLLYMSPAELLTTLNIKVPTFQLNDHSEAINVQTTPDTPPIVGSVLEGLLGLTLDAATFGKKIFSFIVKLELFCLVFGPLLLLLTFYVLSIVSNIMLKASRAAVQPVTSLILARLYESDKGVLTQIGLFVGGAVKLIDEAIKRLG